MSERDETLARPGVDEPDVLVVDDETTDDPPVLLDEPDDTGEVDTPVIDIVDTDAGPVVALAEPVAVQEIPPPEPVGLSELPELPDPGPWAELQGRFVDDPAGCVREASGLVDEAIDSLRGSLTGTADGDTESLRQAFRRYRAVHEALTRA